MTCPALAIHRQPSFQTGRSENPPKQRTWASRRSFPPFWTSGQPERKSINFLTDCHGQGSNLPGLPLAADTCPIPSRQIRRPCLKSHPCVIARSHDPQGPRAPVLLVRGGTRRLPPDHAAAMSPASRRHGQPFTIHVVSLRMVHLQPLGRSYGHWEPVPDIPSPVPTGLSVRGTGPPA